MKVINIILDGRIAGPQLRIVNVARFLKKDGVETIVVFPDKNSGKYKKLLEKYKIDHRVLRLNKLSKNLFGLIQWLFFFIPQVIKLRRIIKEINPDIVHCNSSWQWKGVIAAKLADKKIVWHLNDTMIPLFIKIVFGSLMKFVNGFIVAGSKVKEYYLKNFNIKIPIVEIQAPVDIARFNPNNVKYDEKISKYNGIKILSVGNVNPYKGFEFFIEAAASLNIKYDNLYFFIAGNLFDSQKNYINMLKQKINEYEMKNFIFLGGIDNIEEVLKTVDIYVCSSISEASPQSVWEAMIMKKPVVSTNVGSVPDFIKDNRNGFIVKTRDGSVLANKISFFIENKDKWGEFGEVARKSVADVMAVENIARKHFEIYKRIIHENKG